MIWIREVGWGGLAPRDDVSWLRVLKCRDSEKRVGMTPRNEMM